MIDDCEKILFKNFCYNSLNEICTYMALIDPLSLDILFDILTQSPFADKISSTNG